MRIEYLKDDVEVLQPLAESWALQGKSNTFGVEVDVRHIVSMTQDWIGDPGSEIIVAWNDKEPVGLLALSCGPSFLGQQTFAIEHHWYVKPEFRSVGIRLLEEAVMWAETRNCSHLIMGASCLGGMEVKLHKFYEEHGFKLFSQSYILEVA